MIPIERPYIAPPSAKAHFKRNYERRIAFSIQMRGDLDDIPTIIYYGAPFALIYDVMEFVGKHMGSMMEGYVINNEHSCRYKNGKAYRRISLELHGLQEQYVSLRDIITIINHRMQKLCWCSVKELSLYRLLNL